MILFTVALSLQNIACYLSHVLSHEVVELDAEGNNTYVEKPNFYLEQTKIYFYYLISV